MNKVKKKELSSEAPTVYCPKDKKEVPVWHCIGSYTQGRQQCPNIIHAAVFGNERAKVHCKHSPKNN